MRAAFKEFYVCMYIHLSSKYINAARIGKILEDYQRALGARIRARIRRALERALGCVS